MMQDITHRHEYGNLMRDIPIYDRKNMELADWLLQIEKVVSLTHSQDMNWVQPNQQVHPIKC